MELIRICPLCGEEMEYRNQGIYECPDCGSLIPDVSDEDSWEYTVIDEREF